MADVHRRIEGADYLHGLRAKEFCKGAGEIIGDINYVHPFREGNGRTQLIYLQQLADEAGHPLELSRINPGRWLDASRSAHAGDYARMGREIHRVLESRIKELGR
jgi:cell filamentation protein